MSTSKIISLSIIFLAIFFMASPCAICQEHQEPVQGAIKDTTEGNSGNWTVIESTYATIYVDKDIDLGSVVRRIDVSFARYDPVEERLFLDKGITDAERLANNIDIVVRKAKKILDMHPDSHHINIKIYESEKELSDVYMSIFNEEKDYKAFYIHKFRTIYICFDNVSESVLGHEIGHSIIDSYFTALPPDKIRELLACYVDVHLKD